MSGTAGGRAISWAAEGLHKRVRDALDDAPSPAPAYVSTELRIPCFDALLDDPQAKSGLVLKGLLMILRVALSCHSAQLLALANSWPGIVQGRRSQC